MAPGGEDLAERDRRIRELAAGDPDHGIPRVSHAELARRYQLTRPRITQIVHARPERIRDLASRRRSAVAHLEGLRRERRRIDAKIRIAEGYLRDLDDELLVRQNDRLLGLPQVTHPFARPRVVGAPPRTVLRARPSRGRVAATLA